MSQRWHTSSHSNSSEYERRITLPLLYNRTRLSQVDRIPYFLNKTREKDRLRRLYGVGSSKPRRRVSRSRSHERTRLHSPNNMIYSGKSRGGKKSPLHLSRVRNSELNRNLRRQKMYRDFGKFSETHPSYSSPYEPIKHHNYLPARAEIITIPVPCHCGVNNIPYQTSTVPIGYRYPHLSGEHSTHPYDCFATCFYPHMTSVMPAGINTYNMNILRPNFLNRLPIYRKAI